jgi:hypothetical protein
VNDVKKVNSTPGFVGLEMPDEVPARRLATHFGNLPFSLLNAIFPDIHCPKFDHFLYNRGRMGLADGDEFDLAGGPTTVGCGGCNPGVNGRKSCF